MRNLVEFDPAGRGGTGSGGGLNAWDDGKYDIILTGFLWSYLVCPAWNIKYVDFRVRVYVGPKENKNQKNTSYRFEKEKKNSHKWK